jgi:hypothetical protein
MHPAALLLLLLVLCQTSCKTRAKLLPLLLLLLLPTAVRCSIASLPVPPMLRLTITQQVSPLL